MTCNRMRIVKLVLLCAAVLMLAGTVTAVAGNKLGDVDSDGTVTINDVTAIQMALAESPINGHSDSDVDSGNDDAVFDRCRANGTSDRTPDTAADRCRRLGT